MVTHRLSSTDAALPGTDEYLSEHLLMGCCMFTQVRGQFYLREHFHSINMIIKKCLKLEKSARASEIMKISN